MRPLPTTIAALLALTWVTPAHGLIDVVFADEFEDGALIQRADVTTFRTFAGSNSSSGTDAACATPQLSCRAIDGRPNDGWVNAFTTGPYLQVDSGNPLWGKRVDHFTIVFVAPSCPPGGLTISYMPNGSMSYVNVPIANSCAPGVNLLEVPLDQDAWGVLIQKGNSDPAFEIYEVQFWTTN